jgi:hypothetical protein
MIPQISGKTFLIFLVLFCANISQALAQKSIKRAKPDTIVIYETKVVYDTLYVYDTIRMANPLKNIPVRHLGQADTVSGLLPLPHSSSLMTDTSILKKNRSHLNSLQLYNAFNDIFLIPSDKKYRPHPEEFLCKSPATILKSDIIKSESDNKLMENNTNEKLDNLRFGISAGGGGWWAQSFDFRLRSNMLASPNVGVFFEKTTVHNVSLKIELNYSWLLKKGVRFYPDDYMGTVYSSTFTTSNYSGLFSWDINGESDSEFNFSQISVPIKVGYKVMFIQPYVGLEYKVRKMNNNDYFESSVSALTGVDIHISDRISMAINYSYGISEELNRNGYVQGTTVGDMIVLPNSTVVFFSYPTEDYLNNNTGPLSSQRIDFSLYLNLHKTKRNR